MRYNFDTVYGRKNTNSIKYDHQRYGKPEGLIPLWVADMDFKVPPEVEEALVRSSKHGVFGYSEAGESYWEAVSGWFTEGFGYHPEPGWLVKAPGIVFATAVAIRAYTNEGDAVMLQRPVYHPFTQIINDNNRVLINNPLVYEEGAYLIDFDDFEKKIKQHRVKLFILCSPHNPVGRVWTREELEKIGDICLKNNCLVFSDEIHCDFVYKPHKHTVFSMVSDDFAKISIIATAPSKTFNLPGLQISNIFISNKELRQKFVKEYNRSGYSQLNTMGLVACESAYRHGREWVNQLLVYLSKNMELITGFCSKMGIKQKGIKPLPLEGTYLAWVDFSSMGLPQKDLDDFMANKVGLWLSSGTTFGIDEGVGFQRINIAAPRSVIVRALSLLEQAIR
ncbi:MAG: pyridoxal phosphate-dependent aminotransferase [Chitinispirillia bacterium]|nr:pyridoxal phosphate-dependent aminotransferase [Chitinispirillia bacterium]